MLALKLRQIIWCSGVSIKAFEVQASIREKIVIDKQHLYQQHFFFSGTFWVVPDFNLNSFFLAITLATISLCGVVSFFYSFGWTFVSFSAKFLNAASTLSPVLALTSMCSYPRELQYSRTDELLNFPSWSLLFPTKVMTTFSSPNLST